MRVDCRPLSSTGLLWSGRLQADADREGGVQGLAAAGCGAHHAEGQVTLRWLRCPASPLPARRAR
jgi:hypothetical protein